MRILVGASGLLFSSGFCALVYQTFWMRDFRLLFGASTPATAAVLAVFMGSLGAGSLLLGRRLDSSRRPLFAYAMLEVGITGAAAASPLLLDAVRALYLAIGGSSVLGDGGASVVRLLLACVVMGPAGFLMGGTLPAIGKAVTSAGDVGRRGVALLYGVNTLGAVAGVFTTTFFAFERFGFRSTLWLACLANAVLATLAWALSTKAEPRGDSLPGDVKAPPKEMPEEVRVPSPAEEPSRAPGWLVLGAAFGAGFVFFVAELVWYRLSAPLLGGSTYTFGLVLACTLAGIGLGGVLYAFAPPRRPTLGLLALTCALEAVLLVAPYAAGDHIAYLAFYLRQLGVPSLAGLVAGWTLVSTLLVVPAAIVAGYQLPLLVALAGRGAHGVGRDVGEVYAANTAGSVLGSLGAGFLLLPWLTAPGAWLLGAGVLGALAAAAAIVGLRLEGARLPAAGAAGLLVVALALGSAEGPTALWRHSAIGAGRANVGGDTRGERKRKRVERETFVLEEHEGRESSLAFTHSWGMNVTVNGKSDGSSYIDAPTAVGSALLPAFLHGAPKSAFVVGLGTGQTAGWLGAVPSMERVDVVEIEPIMRRYAELCAASNQNALENPKVRLQIGDGREALLTSREKYNIIVSEPSNPYRAGISSFYTQEFYSSVKDHLEHDGYFAQWVQAYEIDAETLQMVVATLRSVFPYVSVWQLIPRDLLLLASFEPQELDVGELRQRLREPFFRDGFADVMAISDLEGLIAHHLASPEMTSTLASTGVPLCRDDSPLLEYRFARTVGKLMTNPLENEVMNAARARGQHVPVMSGEVDMQRVERLRRRPYDILGGPAPPLSGASAREEPFWTSYRDGQLRQARRLLEQLEPAPASDRFFLAVAAEVFGTTPNEAPAYDEAIAVLEAGGSPIDAAWARLNRSVVTGAASSAIRALAERAIELAREDPWPVGHPLRRSLQRLGNARLEREDAIHLAGLLLERPFANHNFNRDRWVAALALISQTTSGGIAPLCRELFAQHQLWEEGPLRLRLLCAIQHAPDEVAQAQRDLDELLDDVSHPLEDLLQKQQEQRSEKAP